KGSAIPGGERLSGAVECRALGRRASNGSRRWCGGGVGRVSATRMSPKSLHGRIHGVPDEAPPTPPPPRLPPAAAEGSGGEGKGPRVAPRPFRNGLWPDDQARPACFITSAA